jgi:hypothetical protein
MNIKVWWQKYKLQTALATWTLASVAALAGLVLNQNLYFAYYNPTVTVQFGETVTTDSVDRLATHPNLATLDRQSRLAKFQHIAAPEVILALSAAGVEGADYQISQVTSHYFANGWSTVAWGGAIALAMSAAAVYYFGGAALWKRNRAWVVGLVGNYVFVAMYAFLLQMGWLSWSSRLIEISELGIQSLLFAGLWTAIIAFATLQKVLPETRDARDIKTLRELMQMLSRQGLQVARAPLLGWIAVMIGLGLVTLPRFGFDLLTLVVAGIVGVGVNVLVPQFIIQVINVSQAAPNWRKFKLPRRKQKTADKAAPAKVSTASESKKSKKQRRK